ncbi:MAG: preprotein translocase subunit SecA [Deltaproteobacteria bacterium]|nr:preprotein translocase subunit SecA [Deltaproteobacteria bacterium]
MMSFIKKVFGTSNDREIKRILPLVERINSLEPSYQALSDEALKNLTIQFKERLAKGETLDDLLPEAFAAVREASSRQLKMRHYDVQLIGGTVLHQGRISEMKTGEGKTLVATLPLYLNALEGKGVHLVTVNDYLAQRDAKWMSPIFEALGMRVGVIVHGLDDPERKEAYAADITYGTNNEFGFDYLRDNMKVTAENLVQRDLHYAIVDEVDSILVDEARTPLIISGPTNETTDKYKLVNGIIPFLKKDVHFTVDEKGRTVHLTDEGVEIVQARLRIDNLYDPRYIELVHHVDQGLKAHVLFKRDTDYVVKDNQVIIVDEFTGRLMPGRRYSDGLHQALEAKEGVEVANENQTLASITFQNYFRMFKKLSGMTGTADTEAEEFSSIYKLEVTVIPTNRSMIRNDEADVIYKTERAKFRAIANDIKTCNAIGQPILVGTVSIEKSERLSELLKREGIQHVVLNAKHHEKEAHIVANAGQKGAVTIATNMAGRGTDIVLGPGVKEIGGLYILGTERHESRRIDNQLRGRAGRQGDPGKSKFYLSLEDDLLRIFAGDRLMKVMNFLGMEEDEPIEAGMITRAIEDAQNRVEGRNFDIRKHLLKYDDIMNHQRKIVYAWRKKLLFKDDIRPEVLDLIHEVLEELVSVAVPAKSNPSKWDLKLLSEECNRIFGSDLGLEQLRIEIENGKSNVTSDNELFKFLLDAADALYQKKEQEIGLEIIRRLERMLLLHTLDDRWKDHLLDIDHLREGINLRSYAQKDPILDYQKESFRIFETMFGFVKQEFLGKLYRVRLQAQGQMPEDFEEGDEVAAQRQEQRRERIEKQIEEEQQAREERVQKLNLFSGPKESPAKTETVKREAEKVGRNDPCPCGSGKKYKKCHGANSATG